jgi:uncharacterized protein
LLGLMVPILLFLGNQHFGVSSSFRHICAAALPRLKAEYFRYDWKKQMWNLVMMAGVVCGAAIAVLFLDGDGAPALSRAAVETFASWGIPDVGRLQPDVIFSTGTMFRLRSLILLVVGGFLVGFGTRYANGCTSGHAIMGLSLGSGGSVVATIGFFIGGAFVSNLILPLVMRIGG